MVKCIVPAQVPVNWKSTGVSVVVVMVASSATGVPAKGAAISILLVRAGL